MPLFIAIYKNRIDFVEIIMNQEEFNPNWKYQNTSPLYFAVLYNRIDVVKYFLDKKLFRVNSKINDILLFEYSIQKRYFEIAEILYQQPSIKVIGDFTLSFIKKPCNKYLSKGPEIECKEEQDCFYPMNLIQFYLKESNIEELKFQFVDKNKSLLACLAASYSNENDFIQFYNKFKIDINIYDKKHQITPLISSILNDRYDSLNVILTNYKDEIDVNFKTAKKLTALHVLCCKSSIKKEGEKKLFSFENIQFNEHESTHSFAPIHLAVLNNNVDALKLMLNNQKVDVNITCDMEKTPISLVFGYSISVDYKERFELVKLFLEYCKQDVDLMKPNCHVSKYII